MPASPRITSTPLCPPRAPASRRSIVEGSPPRPIGGALVGVSARRQISIPRCYCALGRAFARRPPSARLTPLRELRLPGGVILDAVVDRLAGDLRDEREEDADADQHVDDREE